MFLTSKFKGSENQQLSISQEPSPHGSRNSFVIAQQSRNQIPPIKGGEGGCKNVRRKILHRNALVIFCIIIITFQVSFTLNFVTIEFFEKSRRNDMIIEKTHHHIQPRKG
ncbi:MAG: hypothetical protein DCC43_09230 [Candidatus Brocadia sp.]|nr:hypothetical protein [Candidatus Brocadia sp. AMX3]RIJ98822.1 MAG: hypothetical protein DCC43_09230 [Candidatus Brocadia sp.]